MSLEPSAHGPCDFYVYVDVSGSMGTDEKLVKAKSALLALYEALDSHADRVELNAFNHTIRTVLPLEYKRDVSASHAAAAVAGLRAEGGTILYETVCHGLQRAEAAHDKNSPSRAIVVLLTDGRDEHSTGHTLQHARAAIERRAGAAQARFVVISVGGAADSDVAALTRDFAHARALSCSDARTIKKAFGKVFQEAQCSTGNLTPRDGLLEVNSHSAAASGFASVSHSRSGSASPPRCRAAGSPGAAAAAAAASAKATLEAAAAALRAEMRAAVLLAGSGAPALVMGEPCAFCTKCGRRFKEADSFCGGCGRQRSD